MRIKARMGSSLDGFVSTSAGVPTMATGTAFVPGASRGYPEFIAGCDAVAMGRTTFLPALGAPSWPWGDLEVFVLTSTPLPRGTRSHVVAVHNGPSGLVEALRARSTEGDIHLVGGPRTIAAVRETGALDSLEVVVLPLLLGEGVPRWTAGAGPDDLMLLRPPRAFPHGSMQLTYAVT